MIQKLSVFLLLLKLLTFTYGDVEVRVEELEKQVTDLKKDLTSLSETIDNLEKFVVKRNIADQKLDKAVANVLLNNQEKASMYWGEVVNYLDGSDPDLVNSYLKSLIEYTYLGNSDNFYYVLDFLIRNDLYMGFSMLLKELEQHRELDSGQEVFALAHKVKQLCGMNSQLYKAMPKVVREILEGPVILKSTENNGYIMATDGNFPCDQNSTCYSKQRSQVFVYRLPFSATIENLKNDTKAHWQFVGPDNITELSLGFYMKNMDQDLFFVFSQRPATSMLKGNTTFEPYYSRDMHAQYLPALIPNASPDDNFIRIGVREKMFRKISYYYAGDFPKKAIRMAFSRMPIFQGDVKGFVWEVTPVNEDTLDNTIERDEKCKMTM